MREGVHAQNLPFKPAQSFLSFKPQARGYRVCVMVPDAASPTARPCWAPLKIKPFEIQ